VPAVWAVELDVDGHATTKSATPTTVMLRCSRRRLDRNRPSDLSKSCSQLLARLSVSLRPRELKPCREYPAGMTTACDRILRVTATYPVLGYDRTTLDKLCWAKVVPYTNLMDHRPVCALNETASQ